MEENKNQDEDLNLSVRKYLDQTVVPVLLQGLSEVAAQRPPNPIEFLGQYLLSHNSVNHPTIVKDEKC